MTAEPVFFPRPFGGIRHIRTLTSLEAKQVLAALIEEQDTGHFHNFAVEIDHPDGIRIYGTESLMTCIERILHA